MQRSMASAGLIGLVFLFFALVAYLTGARLYFLFNLVLGVLAIVLWATSSRETFGTLMGHRATRYGANALVYSIGFRRPAGRDQLHPRAASSPLRPHHRARFQPLAAVGQGGKHAQAAAQALRLLPGRP